ncbi:ATP-grasp domain-containing protein [Xenorhabdus bovienii]|uniref:ATP-grasp domain-containing protein n=1 Tax=Xenorhabdus bovienii TaxID=40576 RepID=UPI0004D3CD4C|nr:ATP-grasp domain-containing protein [Xenorhabdus bovienii]CDG88246.1 putative D-alanine--D-alanine ligase [Xenorhabdus bovienii str. feltiae France]CDG92409.1 putative D-alanine--D-alanine ligase [Xenorhabdus bovienii str. feltiae Florida]
MVYFPSDTKTTIPLSIIFGGISPEHPASVSSFDNLIKNFRELNFDRNINSIYFFDKDGSVLYNAYTPYISPDDFTHSGDKIDLYTAIKRMSEQNEFHINLLHGNLGEDGHIQGVAKYFKIKGTFGSVLPSSLSMSKYHMSHYINSLLPPLKSPKTLLLTEDNLEKTFSLISDNFPEEKIVIKPNSLGASLFTNKYVNLENEKKSILDNLKNIFEYDRFALVQAFIKGKEYSVGCIRIEGKAIALNVVEIITKNSFFGHDEKHRINKAEEILLIQDSEITRTLKDLSIKIFESTGYEFMCRFDFIVTESEEIYFLESNPIPGMMKNSIFPKMLKGHKLSIPSLFIHLSCSSQNISEKKSIFNYIIE